MSMYNPELLALAQWRLDQLTKEAFVPPGGGGDPTAGGDPSMGGGMPMDPSMMGGAPPMDPSMAAGGGMPMDPSMAAGPSGAPPMPGGGGMTSDSINQVVSQAVQQAMGGGAAGNGMGKPTKPDINTVAIDIFQVKKMLQHLFNTMGMPLPPDILDGPNRDPRTGTPMPPGSSGSTSDPAAAAAGGGTPPMPAEGNQNSAIPPIQPMQAAGPMAGAEKAGSDSVLHMGNGHHDLGFDPRVVSKAAALAALCRRIQG